MISLIDIVNSWPLKQVWNCLEICLKMYIWAAHKTFRSACSIKVVKNNFGEEQLLLFISKRRFKVSDKI